MKKYCLIESDKGNYEQKLYQIQALKTFTTSNDTEVKAGDLGGFISCEHNLSHEGNCWVANSAEVWDQACVSEYGYIGGYTALLHNAKVYGNARVLRGCISGNVKIYDSDVCGNTYLCGNAIVERDEDVMTFSNIGTLALLQNEEIEDMQHLTFF